LDSSKVAPDLIISHYRVTGRLGAGGIGEVFAGLDETLRRRVALKAIRPERRLDPDAVKEAQNDLQGARSELEVTLKVCDYLELPQVENEPN
jgi:hypothetical protein